MVQDHEWLVSMKFLSHRSVFRSNREIFSKNSDSYWVLLIPAKAIVKIEMNLLSINYYFTNNDSKREPWLDISLLLMAHDRWLNIKFSEDFQKKSQVPYSRYVPQPFLLHILCKSHPLYEWFILCDHFFQRCTSFHHHFRYPLQCSPWAVRTLQKFWRMIYYSGLTFWYFRLLNSFVIC